MPELPTGDAANDSKAVETFDLLRRFGILRPLTPQLTVGPAASSGFLRPNGAGKLQR